MLSGAELVREALGERPDPLLGGLQKVVARIEARQQTGRSVSAVPAPFAQYRDDPVGFFREVLGVEPWGRPKEPCSACRAAGKQACIPAGEASQVELLEAIRDNDLVAHCTGHKLGKSLALAGSALWWVLSRPRGHVIASAPSMPQVKDPAWAELRSLHAGQHPAQAGKTLPRLPSVVHLEPHSGYELGPGWGIWGKATDTPERMAGPSGEHVLYLVDEASGYDAAFLHTILGGLAGGGKLVLFFNPTTTSGFVFDLYHGKGDRWRKLRASSLSSPNFHGGEVPGLAGPVWHDTIAKPNWGGPGSPQYDVRVLGLFPRSDDMVVVTLEQLEAGRERWAVTPEADELDLGVDVARGGDDKTITVPRRGLRMLSPREMTISRAPGAAPPGHQVGDAVAALARELRRPTDRRLPRIKIDIIGVGASVFDHMMAEYGEEFEIIGVNSGRAADKDLEVAPGVKAKERYRNLRTQLCFGVAAWLAAGGALPPSAERLGADLVATKWCFVGQGKIGVEEKAEIKARIGRSPDDGDAAALAIYEEPAPAVDEDYWSIKGGVGRSIQRRVSSGSGRAMFR